jgi:hypothetical protein
MPSTTSSANCFVAPSICTLNTSFDASYNVVVSTLQTTESQTITYDRLFHYHLNDAESKTLCQAFTFTGLKTNPVDATGAQSAACTASFNPAHTGVAVILAKIIEHATDASGNIAADQAGTPGYLTGVLNAWISNYAQAYFQSNWLASANKTVVDNSDLTVDLIDNSGVAKITDLSGSVTSLSGAFDNGLAFQIDGPHLNAYAQTNSNDGPTFLPGLSGDDIVFGVLTTASTVAMKGYETAASIAANPIQGLSFNDLAAVTGDAATNAVPTRTCAFKVTLGCAASAAGEGTPSVAGRKMVV